MILAFVLRFPCRSQGAQAILERRANRVHGITPIACPVARQRGQALEIGFPKRIDGSAGRQRLHCLSSGRSEGGAAVKTLCP